MMEERYANYLLEFLVFQFHPGLDVVAGVIKRLLLRVICHIEVIKANQIGAGVQQSIGSKLKYKTSHQQK